MVVAFAAMASLPGRIAQAQQADLLPAWSLPIRNAGGVPGDGFLIRHGYACENTAFITGWWHTGENWYRDDDVDTANAEVLAVRAGEVVWVGGDYPGRVILVQHEPDLYSMYGHLDYTVDVSEGDRVVAGDALGRVLRRTDGVSPSHLHFEVRNFFYNRIVNGDAPKYDVHCGYRCPPGPGYWPIDDPRHPSDIGWRNPMHLINGGMGRQQVLPEAMVPRGADGRIVILRDAPNAEGSPLAEVPLRSGHRYLVHAIATGPASSTGTSALNYDVWYQMETPSGMTGWVQALIPDDEAVGSDGRPSSVRPMLVPTAG